MKVGYIGVQFVWPLLRLQHMCSTGALKRVKYTLGVIGIIVVNYLATKYISLPLCIEEDWDAIFTPANMATWKVMLWSVPFALWHQVYALALGIAGLIIYGVLYRFPKWLIVGK